MQENHPVENTSRPFGRAMLVLFWLLVLAGLTLFFGSWEEAQYNPNQSPSSHQTQALKEVTLERNRYHHYVADGYINGHKVTFMLDTGATTVAVPKAIADKLGLIPGARQLTNTANGRVEVRSTRVDELKLGPITLNNLRASILPNMPGNEILLGMSALKQLEFSQRGNYLTIRQYR